MQRRLALSLLTACSAFSAAALAHPGHEAIPRSIAEWAHLMLSPDHLPGAIVAGMIVLGVVAAAAVRLVRKERDDDSR